MAKPTENMAISTNDRIARCSLLLVHRGTVRKTGPARLHSHGRWQFELVCGGTIGLRTPEGVTDMSATHGVWIPPRTPHGFDQQRVGDSWLTFRFTCHRPEVPGEPVPGGEASASVRAALSEALPDATSVARANTSFIERMLEAMMALDFPNEQQRSAGLSARIESFVRSRGGTPIVIADIAKKVGYSSTHVSAIYRHDTGRSLKQFIDEERARMARRLLLYSDMNVSEVADQLHFPDVFSFSRFFKRMTSLSPRLFRQRAEDGLDGYTA